MNLKEIEDSLKHGMYEPTNYESDFNWAEWLINRVKELENSVIDADMPYKNTIIELEKENTKLKAELVELEEKLACSVHGEIGVFACDKCFVNIQAALKIADEALEKAETPLNALGHHGAEVFENGQPYIVDDNDVKNAQEAFGSVGEARQKIKETLEGK